MAKFLKDKNTYANKFPTSMKKGGIKKYAKGGFPDLTGDGQVTQADILKGRGVFKKGGSINKTAGKTTTGVVSNYKGYKGPKVKAQVAKVKKAKGKL